MAEDQPGDQITDHGAEVCVIGAGPAGLAAARALTAHDVPYTQYERHSRIGGIWDIDIPDGPMYESAHLISSRESSGFYGFPMPSGYPDYPGHRQVLAYLSAFGDRYGLTGRVRFGTAVARIGEHDGRWLVELDDGTRHVFGAVVCATGSQWHPRIPDLPGTFDGSIVHARDFRSGGEYAGTRTLVIGAGNSGCDIAVDVGRFADRCLLSARRGYWIIPKHIAGVPTDRLGKAGGLLPRRLDQLVSAAIIRLAVGDLRRFGLRRPDHRIYETHPIVSSQILHALSHGDVVARPDVARLEGDRVRFADGATEPVDRIILATGYRLELPYAGRHFTALDEENTYLSTFSRKHRNLFFMGMAESNSGGFFLFDTAAQLIAQYLAAQRDGHPDAAAFARRIRTSMPDLTGGIRLVDSPRHEVYVDSDAFVRAAEEATDAMGWHRANRLAGTTPGRTVPSRRTPFGFDGAIAVVTGGAGGLGLQICRELAERGTTVVVVDRAHAARTAASLPAACLPHRAVTVDLAEPAAAEAVIDAVADLGRVDVLVNNAGMSHEIAFDALTAEQIEEVLRVNLVVPLQLTRLGLDLLRAAPAPRVVFTGSLGGIIAMGSDPLYSASKFGLRGAALSLNLMLASHGIEVSGVHPSAIDTPMLEREARTGAELSQFISPPQSPAEVARVVVEAIERPRPEHYPRPAEAVQAKLAMLAPNLLPRLVPLADRLGARGLDRYLASMDGNGAATPA